MSSEAAARDHGCPCQDNQAPLFSVPVAADEGCCALGIAPMDCGQNQWPHSGGMGVGDEVLITAQLQHASANLLKTDFYLSRFQI